MNEKNFNYMIEILDEERDRLETILLNKHIYTNEELDIFHEQNRMILNAIKEVRENKKFFVKQMELDLCQ